MASQDILLFGLGGVGQSHCLSQAHFLPKLILLSFTQAPSMLTVRVAARLVSTVFDARHLLQFLAKLQEFASPCAQEAITKSQKSKA